jgi:hypothetical protein
VRLDTWLRALALPYPEYGRQHMTVKVWAFRSNREAYDLTQTSDEIKDGDVLYVPSENLVGFLAKAWPIAVIGKPENFHTAREESWSDLNEEYGESIAAAIRLVNFLFITG